MGVIAVRLGTRQEIPFLNANFPHPHFRIIFPLILLCMQTTESSHYKVLDVIYQIVKGDAYPLKYHIHPRELILRLMQDWSEIQSSLTFLEKEGAIVTRQLDVFEISLTEQGLKMCLTSSFEK